LLDAGVDRSPTSLMRDVESVGLLLEAGADPHRYRDDDGEPVPIVRAAVRAGCSIELLELLLAHHAEPNSVGPDGHAPYQNVLKTPAISIAARGAETSAQATPITDPGVAH
jgi:hypothetical protein